MRLSVFLPIQVLALALLVLAAPSTNTVTSFNETGSTLQARQGCTFYANFYGGESCENSPSISRCTSTSIGCTSFTTPFGTGGMGSLEWASDPGSNCKGVFYEDSTCSGDAYVFAHTVGVCYSPKAQINHLFHSYKVDC